MYDSFSQLSLRKVEPEGYLSQCKDTRVGVLPINSHIKNLNKIELGHVISSNVAF